MPDAIEGIGKIGGSSNVSAGAGVGAASGASSGAQTEAQGQTAQGVNQNDSVKLSQDLQDELKQEKSKEQNKAQENDPEKEEKLKKLEEQIKETEKKLKEAIESGDTPTALALMNELNNLTRQRDGLSGQPSGQPELTPQTAGIPGATGGGGVPSAGGGSPGGGGGGAPVGGGGGGAPVGGGGGGSPVGGGGDEGGAPVNNANVPKGELKPDGSGDDAVELGRKYLGQNAIDIKGKLPNFTAAGGQTNNCADFVSSLLESTGRIKGHHINVKEFEGALKSQGYEQVSANQARPGDVWISTSRGHTEMYAGNGRTIGANNDRPGHQVISERAKEPGTGVYYHLKK